MNKLSVLITGAGSGIGRAVAKKYSDSNADLILLGRDLHKLETTRSLCQKPTNSIQLFSVDVSVDEEVERFFIQKKLHFDIAINNAGIEGQIADTYDLTLKDYSQIVDINIKGLWHFLNKEVVFFRKNNIKGSIVNVASIAGTLGIPGSSLYTMTKHAVLGLTKSVALEQIQYGIRINAINPGAIDTPMLRRVFKDQDFVESLKQEPVNRAGTPEEVAEAIYWLASEKASYVVGHSLVVDGGVSID
ncbi:MAG TPA: SDR family oxidoreductase [Pseudobdellovibrionaceae bacterium]|nr:SDR family oxidoreductase [Pseudobdellovibrionaceae bacterium]